MIYLASDIHGHIRLDWLKKELTKFVLSPNDFIILLGDAGIVWNKTEHAEVKDYYNSLPCKTLFIDGNHENFSLLKEYPAISLFGGIVGQVSEKIYHLRRGETYKICDKTFFVFGGGFSLKKLTNSSPVSVWDEEMPNDTEYERGINNLNRIGKSVDYVLSHVAPYSVAIANGVNVAVEEQILNEYLDGVAQNTKFFNWYFGHYHRDFTYKNFCCIYNKITCLGDRV